MLWKVIGLAASLFGYIPAPQVPFPELPQHSLRFQLRHVHGVVNEKSLVFHDVPPVMSIQSTSLDVKTRQTKIHRPKSMVDFHRARLRPLNGKSIGLEDWDEEDIPGPDVTSRESLLELAKMTNNAYVLPDDPAWYELPEKWNNSSPFGFEPDADGFRGQTFVSDDNSTVVLSIKGTSAGYLGSGGPTVRKDRFNDNLLFSCCCARVDWTWTTVCGCYGGGWKCDQDCLEESLQEESIFYSVGANLYNNVTYLYPNANIWLIGHSLGGSLASLLGATFGLPVVAFEAPGEKMAARRLHLPSPPSLQHITHVFHTADSIAMGACNGVLSSCSLAGYAMESRCHLGVSAVYDTMGKLGWSSDIRTHRIGVVIDVLLAKDWEEGLPVPQAVPEEDCMECYSWEYGNFRNGSTISPRSAC